MVAIPHLLPCPAPRGALADDRTPGRTRVRRKCRVDEAEGIDGSAKNGYTAKKLSNDMEGVEVKRGRRECPVPKPGGVVGGILGFGSSSNDGKGTKPP